jgi:hypothetical protein
MNRRDRCGVVILSPLTCRRSLHTHRSRSESVLVRAFPSPVEGSARDLNRPPGAGRESESALRQPLHAEARTGSSITG